MEGKRAKAKLFNLLWHQRKRITAFVLTFAMVLTNIVNDFTVAFAAEIETVTAVFTLNGEDIQNAIDEAIAGGDAYDPSELEISAKSSSLEKAYEKLLGGNGEVYEFFPAIDGINLPDGAEPVSYTHLCNRWEERLKRPVRTGRKNWYSPVQRYSEDRLCMRFLRWHFQ